MRGKKNPFSSSEFALLGALYHTPTHGYDLHKMVTQPNGIGLIWRINMSNLYAYLDKLEKKGLITGSPLEGNAHPNRKEYRITGDGQNAFDEWVNSTVSHPRDFRQDFLARIYYLQRDQPDTIRDLCRRQLEECRKWLSNTQTEVIQNNMGPDFKHRVIAFRVCQIEAIIRWLEKVESEIIRPPLDQAY